MEQPIRKERRAGILLLVWLIANFIPHLVVFLAAGRIYYRLPAGWMIAAESSIMLLNLLLPILTSRYIFRQTHDVLPRRSMVRAPLRAE